MVSFCTAEDTTPSFPSQPIAPFNAADIGMCHCCCFVQLTALFSVDPDVNKLSSAFRSFIGQKLLTSDQKAEAFCGREWLFEALPGKLTPENLRALIVKGNAGVGKSAFIAKAVQIASDAELRLIGLQLESFPARKSSGRTLTSNINILAVHFCEHNNADTLNVALFARSLATSLSKTVTGFVPKAEAQQQLSAEDVFAHA